MTSYGQGRPNCRLDGIRLRRHITLLGAPQHARTQSTRQYATRHPAHAHRTRAVAQTSFKRKWPRQSAVTASPALFAAVSQLPIATVHNKQNILFNIVACCIAYIPLWPTYIPWLPSLHHWRDVIRFGISSLFTNCLAATNHSIPDIFPGKLGNATQVGFSARQTRP